MKLAQIGADTVTSEEFETSQFGIGDTKVVIGILRSKMYSNPPRTIVQELLSNARDANREARRANVPVLVHLPTPVDSNLRIIDNGPGITPDRMENIFIKYGNSTKRKSNAQTGGFGLGAKSPFSYTDTFSIETVSKEENGEKIKRTYIAYIDKSQLGALSLVSSEKVDDETTTGTVISVPVQKEDHKKFIENFVIVTEFWTVKPKLVDIDVATGNYDDSVVSVSYPNRKWVAVDSNGVWRVEDYSIKYQKDREHAVVIDGIPYKLDVLAAFDDVNEKEKVSRFGQPIYMFFNTGEIAVTANREGIDYNDETSRNRIKACIDEIYGSIKLYIRSAAEAYSTSPVAQYRRLRELSLSLLGNENLLETWRGFSIPILNRMSRYYAPFVSGIKMTTRPAYAYRHNAPPDYRVEQVHYPFRYLLSDTESSRFIFIQIDSPEELEKIRRRKLLGKLVDAINVYGKSINSEATPSPEYICLFYKVVVEKTDNPEDAEMKLRFNRLLDVAEIPKLRDVVDLEEILAPPKKIIVKRERRRTLPFTIYPHRTGYNGEKLAVDYKPDDPRSDVVLFVSTANGIQLDIGEREPLLYGHDGRIVASMLSDFGYKTYAVDTRTATRLKKNGWLLAKPLVFEIFADFERSHDTMTLRIAKAFTKKFGLKDRYQLDGRLAVLRNLRPKRNEIDKASGFHELFDELQRVDDCKHMLDVFEQFEELSYNFKRKMAGLEKSTPGLSDDVVHAHLCDFEARVKDVFARYPVIRLLDDDFFEDLVENESEEEKEERIDNILNNMIAYINNVSTQSA